jgi:DNA-3-methyladenine glycosylase II
MVGTLVAPTVGAPREDRSVTTATTVTTTSIPTRGPFSLEELALFGFGHRNERSFDGVMRMAFRVDHDLETATGVEVRQQGDRLDLTVHGPADADAVAAQVARILSCDHDGEGFAELGRRDPVIGALQRAAPGLRPALFYSPYEAAVWSVISARRARAQGITLRDRLTAAHGESFDLAGQTVHALPAPSRLAALTELPGLPADRIPRLHAVAARAQRGDLDADRLVALGPEAARQAVQELPGIGPFYATLIVVRACGFVDVLPTEEARSRQAVHDLYGLTTPMTDNRGPTAGGEYASFAERWKPYRTWAAVLVRAAAHRLPA